MVAHTHPFLSLSVVVVVVVVFYRATRGRPPELTGLGRPVVNPRAGGSTRVMNVPRRDTRPTSPVVVPLLCLVGKAHPIYRVGETKRERERERERRRRKKKAQEKEWSRSHDGDLHASQPASHSFNHSFIHHLLIPEHVFRSESARVIGWERLDRATPS